MMASERQARAYPASPEHVWRGLEQTCANLKWTVQSSDPGKGIMSMKSGAALLCPFGVLLNTKVVQLGPDKIEVTVNAKSTGQVVDYGQAGREIQRFFKELDTAIGSVADRGNQPVATDGSACSKCGKPLPAGARFCRSCGEPVIGPVDHPPEDEIRCSGCGRKLSPEAKFCPGCGAPITQV